jgi:serine phosphatase RsbU (regulator of sigma subunit)
MVEALYGINRPYSCTKTLPEAGGCAGKTLYLPAGRQGGTFYDIAAR